jgi:DNA mismatch repair ATPase MutS
MLKTELTDEYFASIQGHLKELKFREGVLVSAGLGKGNEGTNYVLRKSLGKKPGWIQRLFHRGPPSYTFHIHPRDEAGGQALSQLRDRGINLAANALAQSAAHILSFFVMLRTELAFYVGSVNLHGQLARKGEPVSFPVPAPPGARRHSCVGLYDVCLALSMGRGVVGNELDAEGKNLVIITGANQGGKSTLLRGIGLAQLMMQCGMFVAAESFSADLCRGLFTHYKREEDATMKSGKFDEELSRMSDIVDALTPHSMLLFNESFAATNEREGSEIARQIVRALLETPVKVFFVTHMYEFAHGLFAQKLDNALFLRAERQADGRRSFKLFEDEPLQTSFGADLYAEVFGGAADRACAE